MHVVIKYYIPVLLTTTILSSAAITNTAIVPTKPLETSSTSINGDGLAESVVTIDNLISFTTTESTSSSISNVMMTDNLVTFTTQQFISYGSSTLTPTVTSLPTRSTDNDNLITFTTTPSSSISSIVIMTDNLISQLTSNGSPTVTYRPTLSSLPSSNDPSATSSSNSNTSSATLFIVIGVLFLLLIGSVYIFCIVLCVYRWKRYVNVYVQSGIALVQMIMLFYSTGKYADIKFLKMSRLLRW